jgi:hypothetical protein
MALLPKDNKEAIMVKVFVVWGESPEACDKPCCYNFETQDGREATTQGSEGYHSPRFQWGKIPHRVEGEVVVVEAST